MWKKQFQGVSSEVRVVTQGQSHVVLLSQKCNLVKLPVWWNAVLVKSTYQSREPGICRNHELWDLKGREGHYWKP